jgi:hypothetical protein
VTVPAIDPQWTAARNGMPGDLTAVDQATQVAQFLASHGIAAVYQGTRQVAPAASGATSAAAFSWLAPDDTGWLAEYDVDQPFVLPAGVTTIGRIKVACLPIGAGKGLQVTLYPDNGSGAPNLTAPIVSTTIPADHITAVAAPQGLDSGGPLATAASNTLLAGAQGTTAWTQPAATINGYPDYATPVTSGNWTLFIGGLDPVTSEAVAPVSAAQYLGSGGVSAAVPQPALPQGLGLPAAVATTDTIVVAGGATTSSFATTGVLTASWDPSAGALGAWTAQTALPAASIYAGMAAHGTTVYLVGGSPTASTPVATVLVADATNGQITAWNAGPPLPQAVNLPFTAVVGNWLIVAGGELTASPSSVISAVYYAPINADGSLGSWQTGPALPEPACAVSSGLCQAVTDSAIVLVGAYLGGAPTTAIWVLTVTEDGPAPEWQVQNWNTGSYLGPQVSAYPSGLAGQWELVSFENTSYVTGTLTPVPMISVPLPASGLTPGNTYHVLIRQAQ